MQTDPLPNVDPTAPAIRAAIRAIKSHYWLLRQEQPTWTPHEVLREAKRRSEREMIGAADAIEALDARRQRVGAA